MNLYKWEGQDVLENYGSGAALVLAESAEEAREAVRKAVIVLPRYEYMGLSWEEKQGYRSSFDPELEDFPDLAWIDSSPTIVKPGEVQIFEGSE